MKKFISYIKCPKLIFLGLDRLKLLTLSDKEYIKLIYYEKFNKYPNIDKPANFSEKLQWLKLNDRKKIYTKLVDKYEVKEYVKNIVGEQYIIPTLGVYEKFDDINFNSLPNQFVIKATHDSGGVVICKNKNEIDLNMTREKINNSLRKDYYRTWREWPYKDVKRRIIIEKYMETETGELEDYKFYCFNGKVDYVMYCFDRESGNTKFYYYDKNWNLQKNFSEDGIKAIKNIERPKNLEKMFEIASLLSKGIIFVRVDLYNINGKIYFGEYTFFPSAGLDNTRRKEADEYLNSMLRIGE